MAATAADDAAGMAERWDPEQDPIVGLMAKDGPDLQFVPAAKSLPVSSCPPLKTPGLWEPGGKLGGILPSPRRPRLTLLQGGGESERQPEAELEQLAVDACPCGSKAEYKHCCGS